MTSVLDVVHWNEQNILYPAQRLDLCRLGCPVLRSCVFVLLRYTSHPDTNRLLSVLKLALEGGVPGLELLFGLLWQITVASHTRPPHRRNLELALNKLPDDIVEIYKAQKSLLFSLNSLYHKVRRERPVNRKSALVRELHTEPYLLFEPVALPLEGLPVVDGIVPEESTVFSSSMSPLLLAFRTVEGKVVKIIYKCGDDIRQDHMVLQVIRFMNGVLHDAKVNLCIKTYDVTPTGPSEGLIEYVSAKPVSQLVAVKGALKALLGKDVSGIGLSPPENGFYDRTKVNHFVRSLAGYTVFTYVLCIGDRHLDNVLVTEDGHFLHIDYGFVGREPKPFAPPVKLTWEIVEALGGKSSGYYQTLINLALKAYKVLRSRRVDILAYIHSLCIHGVADVKVELLECIEKRFHPHLSEAEAAAQFISDLERGFEDFLPRFMDAMHRIVT